ncbi:MAG TPA: response regulator [Acidobacteriota bacterium]|nr:response regulator [Acidobacteriota bacterium]
MTAIEGPEIILIEDNPHDAELTIRALKKRNLANNLIWMKDGAEAMDFLFPPDPKDAFLPQHPSVILLDLKLPKVDGLEILRRLKSNEKTRIIPVVVLTSSCEERDVVQSYELGVNSYIVKPVDFDNFSKAVANLGMYWLFLNQPPRH